MSKARTEVFNFSFSSCNDKIWFCNETISEVSGQGVEMNGEDGGENINLVILKKCKLT